VIHLNLSNATRLGVNGLILIGFAMALYQGRMILIPTLIALLLACMLWPAVRWLNLEGIPLPGLVARARFPWLAPCIWRLRVPWSIACAAAVGVLVVLVLMTAVGFGLAVPRFLQQLPNDPEKAQRVYSQVRDRLERISPWPMDPYYFPEDAEESEAVKYIRNALDPKNPQFVFSTLLNLAQVGVYGLWQSILILFLLLFLLLEGRMLTRRLVEVFGPSPLDQARVVATLQDMANQLRVFLVWRTIINFGMAVVLGVVYQVAGLSQGWTWALVTAVLLYVPYLGPILAGVPPALDAFVTCESPFVAVGLLMFYVAFITVEGYFIVPVVMGRSMELNATTVMLSCLFWELVWGWAGLFLAMPLMAAAKTICYHVPSWRPWANLMDTRAEPPDVEPPQPGDDGIIPRDALSAAHAEAIRQERADGTG
jgi:predicted PurR-regulated permease PerM